MGMLLRRHYHNYEKYSNLPWTGGRGGPTIWLMDQSIILDYGREAIWITLKIGAPVMVIGLLVGVVVALFQALTQIQEMTLTFVPKIIAIFVALFVLLPYMGMELAEFTRTLADQIIGLPTN